MTHFSPIPCSNGVVRIFHVLHGKTVASSWSEAVSWHLQMLGQQDLTLQWQSSTLSDWHMRVEELISTNQDVFFYTFGSFWMLPAQDSKQWNQWNQWTLTETSSGNPWDGQKPQLASVAGNSLQLQSIILWRGWLGTQKCTGKRLGFRVLKCTAAEGISILSPRLQGALKGTEMSTLSSPIFVCLVD